MLSHVALSCCVLSTGRPLPCLCFQELLDPSVTRKQKLMCVEQNQSLVAHGCCTSPACGVPTPEGLVQVVYPNVITGPLGHGLEATLSLMHLPWPQPFSLPFMPAARALSLSQLLVSVCKQGLFLNKALSAFPALWAQCKAMGLASSVHPIPPFPKSPGLCVISNLASMNFRLISHSGLPRS